MAGEMYMRWRSNCITLTQPSLRWSDAGAGGVCVLPKMAGYGLAGS